MSKALPGLLTIGAFGLAALAALPDIEARVQQFAGGLCPATAAGPNLLGFYAPCLGHALAHVQLQLGAEPLLVAEALTREPYPARVPDTPDCRRADPDPGCDIRYGEVATGWRLVHQGRHCVREDIRLTKWMTYAQDGYRMQAPTLTVQVARVPCSSI